MNYYNKIKNEVNKKEKDTKPKKQINESQNKHINSTIPIKSNKDIIKQTNGNIPIKNELLDKYSNAKEMMNKEKNNYDGKVDIQDASKIEELNHVNLSEMTKSYIYHLATNIFDTYNSTNTFKNDGNEIKVSHADIKECMKKIYKEDQLKYLKEHLQVFSDLGDVIESATLTSQSLEQKRETQKKHINNNVWSYYLNGLDINGDKYLLEFDVVSRENGENHYRVQGLQKTDAPTGNTVNNSVTPDL